MNVPITPGSQLSDQDLIKWIETKLGDTTELWSGSLAASLISKEMLSELETCFQALDSHVKLKIILAIPHLSHRRLQDFRAPLQHLLTNACRDADEWIEATASMYSSVFKNGSVSTPESEKNLFNNALIQLEKIVQDRGCSVNEFLKQLPLESSYMTHFAIRTAYGCPERQVDTHFNLKKKPKSTQLLDEVTRAFTQLGESTCKGKSNGVASSFPLRMRSTARKPNNTLPMRGIRTVSACKQSAGFSNEPRKFNRPFVKREGGAKLLELDEIPQPILKKRRRVTEFEETKPREAKKRRESECLSSPTSGTFSSPTNCHEADKTNHDSSSAAEKPRPRSPKPTRPRSPKPTRPRSPKPTRPRSPKPARPRSPKPARPRTPKPARPRTPKPALTLPMTRKTPGPTSVPESYGGYMRPTRIPRPLHEMRDMRDMRELRELREPRVRREAREPQVQEAEKVIPEIDPVVQYCEDLYRSSNRLDQNGYFAILSFMRGNRVPHPSVPTIESIGSVKLTESREALKQADGTTTYMLVETIFEMDYTKGEWKRLRKVRPLRDDETHANSLSLVQEAHV